MNEVELPDDGTKYCSDEEFAKFTGGCLYRGHFPDFNAMKEMQKSYDPSAAESKAEYICPRCLKSTVFDLKKAMWTGKPQ